MFSSKVFAGVVVGLGLSLTCAGAMGASPIDRDASSKARGEYSSQYEHNARGVMRNYRAFSYAPSRGRSYSYQPSRRSHKPSSPVKKDAASKANAEASK